MKQYTQRWWQNKITRMYKIIDNGIMQIDLLKKNWKKIVFLKFQIY